MANASLPQVKDEVLTFSIKVVGCVWDGTLKVTSKTTLRDLKLMLVPHAKPITKHELLFLVRGEQIVALDQDECDLNHYGVEDADKIWLYVPFRIAKLLVPSVGLSNEFKIRDSHSVLDIKKLIEDKWGVPAHNLILYYSGVMMEDSKCLDDYEFCDYMEIYVVVRKLDARKKIVLTVSMFGLGEREICVEECFTGMDIKTVVESASHWPASTQLLSFGDHDSDPDRKLYDWDTVLNCGLKDMMKLRASGPQLPSMHLHILHGGRNIATVSANPLDTVTYVMNAIQKEVQGQPGHEPAFFIGDTKLEPHKYLAHYDLKDNSRVSLEWVIRLAVTLPGGRVKGVIIKRGYTVDEVKKLIEKQCDIPCWMQKLSHMNEEDEMIPVDKTICDCEKLYGTGLSGLRWNKQWSFFFPTYASDHTKPAKVDMIPDDKTICDCEKLHASGFSGLRWDKKWSFFFPSYTIEDTKHTI